MKNIQTTDWLQKSFHFSLYAFVLLLGLGQINLKKIGIPISLGGEVSKLIIWPLLLGFINSIHKKKSIQLPFTFFLTALLFLMGLLIYPCLKDLNDHSMTFYHSFLFSFLSIFIIGFVNDQKIIHNMFLFLIFGASFSVIKGLFFTHFSHQSESFTLIESQIQRLTSSIGHPNFMGCYIMMIIPYVIFFIHHDRLKTKRSKITALLGFILYWGLFTSYSRNAWISHLLSLCLYCSFIDFKKARILICIGSVILASLVLIQNHFPEEKIQHPAMKRIVSILNPSEDRNIIERVLCWKTSLKIIKNNPKLGIGPGNEAFYHHYEKLREKESLIIMPHPHQLYLHVPVVFGLPLFILFMLLIFLSLFCFGFNIIKSYNLNNFLQISVFCSLFSILIYGFLDSPLFAARVAPIFWMNLALLSKKNN